VLTGVPLGCFTTVAPTYASEMAPLPIRGAITAGMNFVIVLGQLIGYGVEHEASQYAGALTYKILFATQWGLAVVGLDDLAVVRRVSFNPDFMVLMCV
jgi:MFS family permease